MIKQVTTEPYLTPSWCLSSWPTAAPPSWPQNPGTPFTSFISCLTTSISHPFISSKVIVNRPICFNKVWANSCMVSTTPSYHFLSSRQFLTPSTVMTNPTCWSVFISANLTTHFLTKSTTFFQSSSLFKLASCSTPSPTGHRTSSTEV